MTTQTRVGLTKVKYSAFASQETHCMEAVLTFDGKPVCVVSNDGHGGADYYHSLKGTTNTLMHDRVDEVQAYCKSLPPVVCSWDKNATLPNDLELVVGDLMNEWLLTRDYQRATKSKVLFIKADGKCYQMGIKGAKTVHPGLVERVQAQNPGATILNVLPLAEALPLYRQAAGGGA